MLIFFLSCSTSILLVFIHVDVDQPTNIKDPLHISNGPITRSKTKVLKETLNGLVVQVSTKTELGDLLKYQNETLEHLIHMQEGLNSPLFGPWSLDNKAANFISISASLIFHLFYGFLTSFGFPIMCGNINYYFSNIRIYYFYFIFLVRWKENTAKKTKKFKLT